MKARFSWVCHGSTEANRKSRFPADEPLEARSIEQARRLAGHFGPVDRVWTSPALRARETAAALGLQAAVEPALRECGYGRWQGREIAALHAEAPEALGQWMTDDNAAPHGGEALSAVLARVGGWMAGRAGDGGHTVVVTHATVIRAAIVNVLRAPFPAFWAVDIEPLGMVEMTGDGRRWQLRFPNPAR